MSKPSNFDPRLIYSLACILEPSVMGVLTLRSLWNMEMHFHIFHRSKDINIYRGWGWERGSRGRCDRLTESAACPVP